MAREVSCGTPGSGGLGAAADQGAERFILVAMGAA